MYVLHHLTLQHLFLPTFTQVSSSKLGYQTTLKEALKSSKYSCPLQPFDCVFNLHMNINIYASFTHIPFQHVQETLTCKALYFELTGIQIFVLSTKYDNIHTSGACQGR